MKLGYLALASTAFSTIAVACGSTDAASDESNVIASSLNVCGGSDAQLQPRFQRVDVGEVSLNVATQGDSKNPAIVLLHGFPDFWCGWAKVIPTLAKDYFVIAPDLRGYNDSDKPGNIDDPLDVDAYKPARLVEDVRGLIAKTTNEKPLLVGHDFGGALAWTYANTYPETIRGLVVMNAPHPDVYKTLLTTKPTSPDDPAAKQQQASAYMVPLLNPAAMPVLKADNFEKLSGLLKPILTAKELEAHKTSWANERSLEATVKWYRALFDLGLAEDGKTPIPVPKADFPTASNITVPVRVLWGDKDPHQPMDSNTGTLGNYVKASLKVSAVEGAGHFVQIERPDVVAKGILEFAKELPSTR